MRILFVFSVALLGAAASAGVNAQAYPAKPWQSEPEPQIRLQAPEPAAEPERQPPSTPRLFGPEPEPNQPSLQTPQGSPTSPAPPTWQSPPSPPEPTPPQLPRKPDVREVFDRSFLPPVSERNITKVAK